VNGELFTLTFHVLRYTDKRTDKEAMMRRWMTGGMTLAAMILIATLMAAAPVARGGEEPSVPSSSDL
jgi:hypothetical protein